MFSIEERGGEKIILEQEFEHLHQINNCLNDVIVAYEQKTEYSYKDTLLSVFEEQKQ